MPIETRTHKRLFRRAGRSVTVEVESTFDPERIDPETGEKGFEFTTLEQARAADARIAERWQAKYGGPLPPKRGPGPRPSGDSRKRTVTVRLSEEEIEALDRARGDLGRSEFIRGLVARAAG